MNKTLFSMVLMAVVFISATAKDEDPVLMTVNGKDVPLSEFEYLYHKNNSQQIQPQTLDEYVDMFVIYKLKVADAEAAGLDTLTSFKREFNGYRNELARPYLHDDATEERLVNESYSHMQEEVDVSHIMLQLGMNADDIKAQKEKLDSIRTEIINGKATFEEMAEKYSVDSSTKRKKGHMGFITANQCPYPFEVAAYETNIGDISQVIETPFGYHIVKVNAKRPARGQVLVQHILKLIPKDATPEVAAAKKAEIDSIYQLLKAGADFSEVAKIESEDPGSARQGGMLDWFGTGAMVPEFDQVAFSLANGELSEPFPTQYGYHIIHRIDGRDIEPFEQAKQKILNTINNDERGNMADKARLEQLKEAYNSHIIDSALKTVYDAIVENDGYDSTVIRKFAQSTLPIIEVGDSQTPVKDVIRKMPLIARVNVESGQRLFKNTAEQVLNTATREYERQHLAEKYPDYKNLINEYRDGMLLFEISNRNVWEKASKDKEGLEQFFNANRDKYVWTSPKYKGFIIFATNDSIFNAAQQYVNANDLDNDSVATVLRKQFGHDIKVERVIAAKGENDIVDNIAFGGAKPEKGKNKWEYYFGYKGVIIDNPEEAADVRGPVTSDYQALLEKQWVDSLKAKYPVKINKKVLKEIK